ncbi:MAG: ABC transporter permease [Tissierellia bacterium]|nr:ABC transporter permease [Tissierellia bacterium]
MRKHIRRIYLGLILFLLYLPILVLIVFSFNDTKLRGVWAGFTLHWYQDLFSDSMILRAFFYTALVALIATLVSTLLGTLSAIGIYALKNRQKNWILNVNYLPILNPDIVTGVALMSLYAFFRLDLGLLTLTLSHIVFCLPYVIISVLPKLEQLNRSMIEAALDLGATPAYAMVHVIFPQIKPGVVSGALMAFTLSIDDFIISFFTTGKGVSNLSIALYSMTKTGVNPSINALSTLLFVSIFLLLLLMNYKGTDLMKFEV